VTTFDMRKNFVAAITNDRFIDGC